MEPGARGAPGESLTTAGEIDMDRRQIANAFKSTRVLVALAALLIVAIGLVYKADAIFPGCMLGICVALYLLERPAWASWRASWFKAVVPVVWAVLTVSFLLPGVRVYSAMSGAECFWIALQYQWLHIGEGKQFINQALQSIRAGRLSFVGEVFDIYFMRMLVIANLGVVVLPVAKRWLPDGTARHLSSVWLGCAAAAWAFPLLWSAPDLEIGYYVWSAALFLFALNGPMSANRVYLVMAVVAVTAVRGTFGSL